MKSAITLADVETAVRAIAATALRNEQYFCELDSFAGDADFGVSLASGFRVVEQNWKDLDRSSIGNFLLKISMIITSNVGGCSGPIRSCSIRIRRAWPRSPSNIPTCRSATNSFAWIWREKRAWINQGFSSICFARRRRSTPNPREKG